MTTGPSRSGHAFWPRTPGMRAALVSMVALLAGTACGDGVDGEGSQPDSVSSAGGEATAEAGSSAAGQAKYREQLGEYSPKIRREDGRTYVYAGGELESGEADWFDFTGASIDPEDLQFGAGKHAIPPIDDPVFVEPDDPRLLDIPSSRFRPDEDAETTDEIMVIGYVTEGVAKAYPTALLDHHEVVNDRIRGKPISVGW